MQVDRVGCVLVHRAVLWHCNHHQWLECHSAGIPDTDHPDVKFGTGEFLHPFTKIVSAPVICPVSPLPQHLNNIYLSVRMFDTSCRHFLKINVGGVHLEYYRKSASSQEVAGEGVARKVVRSSRRRKCKLYKVFMIKAAKFAPKSFQLLMFVACTYPPN